MDFRLFGLIEVVTGEGEAPLDLGPTKQRAVLALLALNPGEITTMDRLADELWPEGPPAKPMGTLQAYISNLRKALEPGRLPRTPPRVLVTRARGYQLTVVPEQVDLTRFACSVDEGRRILAAGDHPAALERLTDALSLWRGDPLAEFADYPFAQPVAARLRELRHRATEDIFEARLALGDSGSCVPDLEQLVDAHPYRERLWGLLVLALYRAGRQAEALGALRRVRAVLAGELGLEPGPELRRLEQAVFEQAAWLEVPQTRHISSSPPAPTPRLIGREAHLQRIGERLDDLRRARGGVLIIGGEPGTGKTRLADAAADLAAVRGVTAAWSRCVEDSGAPAFWPWIQALQGLPGELPRLAQRLRDGGQADMTDPGTARFQLCHAVARVLHRPGTPILIVMEDIHRADAASLKLLTFVAAGLHRSPVLVLATVRPEPVAPRWEPPEALTEALAELTRQRGTERMSVGPLTAEQIPDYLAEAGWAAAGPGLARALHDRTGGNPFFLRELLCLLSGVRSTGRVGGSDVIAAAVPDGVRDVVNQRVSRLPEDCQRLLRVAAAIGRDVDVGVLASATGVGGERLMTLLEPAVATGLLVEVDGGWDYRFSHVLVQEALCSGLSRLERARLHGRAVEVVESPAPGDGDARLPAPARHSVLAARTGPPQLSAVRGDRPPDRAPARRAGTCALRSASGVPAARPAPG
ncbi:BTAD domain-containing putative transcriptional regulator [Microbispora sp. NPDC046933]|uniref:BTAD domain-containing putative transcriptional regulator n=1 Tax=Microbispora sp. NPDC046933 TaxID=3155618 RepID=UPI0033D86837